MKERLLQFLEAENKTSAQLAEEIGVQPSGISHILSGRNNPSLDFVLKMLEKYKFLSTDWLLFGKGSMYKESSMQNLFDQAQVTDENEPIAEKEEAEKAEEPELDKKRERPVVKSELSVEKVVWFYSNNSFREYFPEKE